MRKPIIRSNVSPLALPQLFTAGRAVLTFKNTEKDTHMTVRSKQLIDRNTKERRPIFYVSVSLLGDAETGFRYAGTWFSDTQTYKLHSTVQPGSQMHRVMEFLKSALINPQILRDKKVSLLHEGKCVRCGLPLTNPESISIGLGSDCLEHQMNANKNLTPEHFKFVNPEA
jgi:hypothetical protein